MGNEPGTDNHQMPNQQPPSSHSKHRLSYPSKQPKPQQPQNIRKHVNHQQQKKPSASKYHQPHPHQQYQSIKSHNNSHNNAPPHTPSPQPHTNGIHHNNGYNNIQYTKHNNTISPAMTNVTNMNHNKIIKNVKKKEIIVVNKNQNQNKENGNKHFKLNNKMTINDFEIMKLVGRGSFGEVWQVKQKKTMKIYALKILKKKDLVARKQVIHTNTERRILANIDHPFLVSLRYAFQTKAKLFMVMDFFNGGELFFHLQNEGKFNEIRATFYSAEICLAIECLHKNNITYRDLKPENILLDCDGHIKITDFGLSKESISADPSCVTRTFCGSPEYLAPEMLQQNGYNCMVDWWSFGTILYEMICGLPPFYDANIQKMYQNILYAKIPFYHFMSRESIQLITKLLIKNPTKRIKCKDIKLSKFFSTIDWDKLYKKKIEPPFKPRVMDKNDVSNFQKFEQKTYLNATPSIKTNSVLAAEGAFPGFTYDETNDNEILYVD